VEESPPVENRFPVASEEVKNAVRELHHESGDSQGYKGRPDKMVLDPLVEVEPHILFFVFVVMGFGMVPG
jgi:hypothetical protein